MREEDVIGRLRETVAGRPSPEGIGDDGAVLRESDGRVVVLDTMVEGIHFDRRWSSWSDVGFKLIATNVSDVWAMGATPTTCLLSLSLPRPLDTEMVHGIAAGVREALEAYAPDAVLVGGDTTGSPGPVFLSLTMLGRQVLGPLTRDRLRPGQALWVDGPLGFAAAGVAALEQGETHGVEAFVLQHRRPQMRVPDLEGWRRAGVVAAMDVSDGLALDLHRMAVASGVHVELRLPLPGYETLATWARTCGVEVEAWQLGGGDDYVRVVAASHAPGEGWARIGDVVDGPAGLTLLGRGGTRLSHNPTGFRHFT